MLQAKAVLLRTMKGDYKHPVKRREKEYLEWEEKLMVEAQVRKKVTKVAAEVAVSPVCPKRSERGSLQRAVSTRVE
ncbi:MAG: hypothetical protein ACREBS_01270 [Nitrososphaerales archaeon]